MKKIPACLFVVLSSMCLSAQNYIPLLQNENQWDIFGYDYKFNPDCGWQSGYRYYIDGDSLVDGQQYSTFLKVSFDGSGSSFFCPPFTLNNVQNELAFLIREDTLNHQVFLWNGSEEVLLYDFSLTVGDEITVSDIGSTYTSEVTFVDTIITDDGIERRRLQLGDASSPPNLEWVEGIGSIYGLVIQYGIGNGAGTTLLCFRQDDQGVYGEDCGLLLGLGDVSLMDNEIVTLSPNPSKDILLLTWQGDYKITSFKAFDAQGSVVFSEQNYSSLNLTGASNTFSIDMSSFSAGIYFIQIEINEVYTVKRWVKE